MPISRRGLIKKGLKTGVLLSAAAALPELPAQQRELPAPFEKLKPVRDRIRPITAAEYRGRIQLAQRFMTEAKPAFAALYITPGTSLYYFTGIHWALSERLLALVIPRRGEPVMICPAFEEGRLRELLPGGVGPIEVRAWQEDENASARVSEWLAERGIRTGRVGIEETTRFTFYDALRRASPPLVYSSGDRVTI